MEESKISPDDFDEIMVTLNKLLVFVKDEQENTDLMTLAKSMVCVGAGILSLRIKDDEVLFDEIFDASDVGFSLIDTLNIKLCIKETK